MDWLLAYLLFVNLAGLYLMWADKQRAKKRKWRISERTLFFVAVIGGCLGTTLGIYLFRHKTLHKGFKFGMLAILVAETAVLFYGMLQCL